MSTLEGALANVPGLAGYLGQKQYDEQQQAGQLQQVSGLLSLRNSLDTAAETQKIRGILAKSDDLQSAIPELIKTGSTGITLATHLAALDKAQEDAKAGKTFTALMQQGGGQLTPELATAAGNMNLSRGNHAAAAPLYQEADRLRKAQQDAAALTSMKSTPEVQAVGPVGPQIPAPAQPGVVPPYLLQSQQYGSSAQALQDRINKGYVPTSTAAEGELSKLTSAYNSSEQAKALVSLRGKEARDTKAAPAALNAQGVLTPEAIAAAKARYALDGTMPPNLGRGTQGAVNTALILNAHAAGLTEDGQSPEAAAAQQVSNKANKVALTAVSKDLSAIEPFSAMLHTNAKIAIDLAKKISESRTGSQLVNRPISWLQLNAGDNPDIAEYLFQIQTVKTEGARILNNPRLVGQLTDSARHEMGDVVNGNMPLGQTERVLKRMVSDGDNRVNAIKAQRDELVRSMGGAAPAPSTGVKEFATESDAAKAGLKAGDRVKIGGVVGTWK